MYVVIITIIINSTDWKAIKWNLKVALRAYWWNNQKIFTHNKRHAYKCGINYCVTQEKNLLI